MSDLKELQWQQHSNEVIIKVSTDKFEDISFLLNEKLINFLASNTPKMYVFYIELNNEAEQSYLVDFNNLKSIVSHQNSLKITMGKQKKTIEYSGVAIKGKFCIARGESYHERHLNENGWQHQRKYFDIYDVNEIKSAKVTETITKQENSNTTTENTQNQATHKNISSSGKLKECVKCAEIIPAKLEICPYCKANQNDLSQKDDDAIDISI